MDVRRKSKSNYRDNKWYPKCYRLSTIGGSVPNAFKNV
jgi:hypothetical protein